MDCHTLKISTSLPSIQHSFMYSINVDIHGTQFQLIIREGIISIHFHLPWHRQWQRFKI